MKNSIFRILNPRFLAGRLALSLILITAIQLVVIGLLVFGGVAKLMEEQLGHRALAVSMSVAHIPEIAQILERGADPDHRIQILVEDIRKRSGADFVVVGDRNEIRYSHPDPGMIGKQIVGGDITPVIKEGRSYVSRAEGTLGVSIRGKVPLYNADGEIVGVVLTGFLLTQVHDFSRSYQHWIVLLCGAMFSLALMASVIIARRFKRAILGMEPQEIALLYQQKCSSEELLLQKNDQLEIAVVELENAVTEIYIAREAAEAANRAKNMFLTNMSHELRTPLNAVLGFAGMLERDASLPVVSRDKAKTIVKSGEHLLAIINDILEMARIEANRVELHDQPLDLHTLLDDLECMFQLRAKEKGISFAIDRAADLSRHIVADQDKLRQILFNLLGNAVKFTGQGSVLVRALNIGADRIVIEVQDTGIGIADQDMPKLFRPFEQINRGLASYTDGIGLGLAISREHACLMGGDISAVCQIGKGCCFRFEFHAPPSDVAPATVEVHLPVAAGGEHFESGGAAESPQSPAIPTLERMSSEWLEELGDALARRSITRLRQLGEEAKESDPALADWLLERVGKYDLEGLKRLEETK
jgi:signal transduction histidine kinase